MNRPSLRKTFGALLFGLCAFALSGWAHADPPSRVARLAYASGALSFSPAGENDWVRASVNRPLVTGDRLWSDTGALGELQLGGAAIRMGARTSMTLLNVDDRTAQVQLTQGVLNIRVWRFDRDQVFEIDTPNLAYSIRSPGSYRIEVDAKGDSTAVLVRAGQAEVFGEGSAFVIEAGQGFEFFDTALRDYDSFAPGPADDFDRWSSERDRRWENSTSARFVSRELIGYEDLDDYGSWREVSGYGPVWTPTRVAADWAPYRDGHWAWVEPWGWTWVDDAPWGFAPSHYGRWANIGGSWGWVPGPLEARPVYAPALVAFVGGSNFSVSLNFGGGGAVAWFPLGPRDVYRPSYQVSREYFTRVNSSSTVINTVNITNVYNNTNITNVTYVNQHVPGAVVAVPAAAFVQSRPVARESVRVTRDMATAAPVMAVVPFAPVRSSVLGAAVAGGRPPENAAARPVVARTAPPPPPAAFATRERALAVNPGRPLDAAALPAVRPAAPAVTVMTPPAQATLAPPPPRPAAVGAPERTRPAERSAEEPRPPRPAMTPRGFAPPPGPSAPPPVLSAPAPAPSAQEERGRRAPVPGPRPPEAPAPREAMPPAVRGPNNRPPVEAPVVPPRAAAPAATPMATPLPPPPPQPPGVEAPGRRARPDAGRAGDRREAASDARGADGQRRRAEEEPGRRP